MAKAAFRLLVSVDASRMPSVLSGLAEYLQAQQASFQISVGEAVDRKFPVEQRSLVGFTAVKWEECVAALKVVMKERRVSQRTIARTAGLNSSTVCCFLGGKGRASRHTVVKLCEWLKAQKPPISKDVVALFESVL